MFGFRIADMGYRNAVTSTAATGGGRYTKTEIAVETKR
jgi:hypothetical protein